MATYSSILVQKTPWTEEPTGLQSYRVCHGLTACALWGQPTPHLSLPGSAVAHWGLGSQTALLVKAATGPGVESPQAVL